MAILTQRKIDEANRFAGIYHMYFTRLRVWSAIRGMAWAPDDVLGSMTAKQLGCLLKVQMHAYMAGQDSAQRGYGLRI